MIVSLTPLTTNDYKKLKSGDAFNNKQLKQQFIQEKRIIAKKHMRYIHNVTCCFFPLTIIKYTLFYFGYYYQNISKHPVLLY